jgi:transmembrane sensor
VNLGPGDALRLDRKAVTAVKLRVAPDQVGSWRSGRFIYDGEPLSQVAEDLGRYVGAKIAVAPEIADEKFRGAISVRDPHRLEPLGPLFRARLQRQGAGWLISRP